MSNETTFLSDYKRPTFTVNKVDLNFDLYDEYALVTSQIELQRQEDGSLHLLGNDLELESIRLNGQPLQPCDYQLETGCLVISDCPNQCSLEIVTRIYPQHNTQLLGLYRSGDLFCTQCEAQGFRRITFFPDRPDVLAVFTTRITADKVKYPVLLSNGELIGSGDIEDGRHWCLWRDPFRKPAYLFALVAGRLGVVEDTYTTESGKKIDLRMYVEPGEENKCTHAMNALKKAMKWDEDNYGREYDLSVYMIVAVSHFNGGAMENKGLNIFNAKHILVSPETATDQDFSEVETIIAHEYFHNWTGNRITCRDWFQLSLKEGLTVFRDQEFTRDTQSRALKRIMDVKLLVAAQFPEDAGSMFHSVRPNSYQEVSNFYTATVYHKGAEVIRMLHTLLGRDTFRRGMDLYFERHDQQAVTIEDFLAVMEEASRIDLTQFKRWYSQAGTPEVCVETEFYEGCLTLRMKQSCRATQEGEPAQPFHIPVRWAMYDACGQKISCEDDILELTQKEQTFSFHGIQSNPLVSLLDDFSAPIKLDHPQNMEQKIALLQFASNDYAQWQAAQSLVIECMHQWLSCSKTDWTIPQAMLAVFRGILLRDSEDFAFQAELLSPPWHQELIGSLVEVDISRVESVRDAFYAELGLYLYPQAQTLYDRLWQQEDHQMNVAAYGRRKLRNICLWLMMKADKANAIDRCQRQFLDARTMTDQLASFSLLNNVDLAMAQRARDAFYRQWKHNPLVLDKWFSVQATGEAPDTLERVKTLLNHEAFDINNPNSVHALIGNFCQRNPRNFHAADGKGYAFLTETLLLLDAINPHIAAHLANPFTHWRQLNQPRRIMISACLQQLANSTLSKNLTEVVEKSLRVRGGWG